MWDTLQPFFIQKGMGGGGGGDGDGDGSDSLNLGRLYEYLGDYLGCQQTHIARNAGTFILMYRVGL